MLDERSASLFEMASIVETAIVDSSMALASCDPSFAAKVFEAEERINRKEMEIDELARQILSGARFARCSKGFLGAQIEAIHLASLRRTFGRALANIYRYASREAPNLETCIVLNGQDRSAASN